MVANMYRTRLDVLTVASAVVVRGLMRPLVAASASTAVHVKPQSEPASKSKFETGSAQLITASAKPAPTRPPKKPSETTAMAVDRVVLDEERRVTSTMTAIATMPEIAIPTTEIGCVSKMFSAALADQSEFTDVTTI